MAKSFLKLLAFWNTLVFTILLDTTRAANWSCYENATSLPVNIDQVSGLWYEVSRFPQSEVPACLKIYAPSAIENNQYILQLKYVNNLNNEWKHTEENVTFPWSNNTKAGLFELKYSGASVSIDVNFKYMGTFQNYTLVCGYSGMASGISIFRLLSRSETVSSDLTQTINKLLARIGVDSSTLTWVQQGGKCNGASNLSPCLWAGFMTLLILMKLTNFKT